VIVDVKLPQWGMGMSEGTILEWIKQVGETVTEGEPLVEVETAKTTEVVESPATGVLVEILVAVGTDAEIYTVLARIECRLAV
jgi:pyruvate/2-oxoglutarate dehydrogenase complex dihydrolipoamide acyltransferase (E2) component